MIHVTVIGAAGQMGKTIITELYKDKAFSLVGAIEQPNHSQIGYEIEILTGIPMFPGIKLSSNLSAVLAQTDVVIDFSSPESTLAQLRCYATKNIAAVIGTTGFSKEQRQELEPLLRQTRAIFGPNMSIGMNVMYYLTQELARLLPSFDPEIVEFHHNRKKDAPSGSAMKLAEIVAKQSGRNLETDACYGRKGSTGVRSRETIGIHSVRGGDWVGEHRVLFLGTGEKIELVHQAQSRINFAQGAVLAAKWILTQTQPGIYDMSHVLNLCREG